MFHPLECNGGDAKGNPTELTLERYRKFAEGAPGLIFVEACQGWFKLVCHQEPAGCTSHDERYKRLLRQVSKKRKQ